MQVRLSTKSGCIQRGFATNSFVKRNPKSKERSLTHLKSLNLNLFSKLQCGYYTQITPLIKLAYQCLLQLINYHQRRVF